MKRSYSVKKKSRSADRYGVWKEGRQMSPDVIAGSNCVWPKSPTVMSR